ncbi:DoxX family protein [Streptomyces actuosus]|uniref:DoxX family protein n=1 Tax=Streptomyces actuosus TaxID=1885 RepID=A0ABS2VLR1_STRAS|nr:DoxX family protein [Streptomyces actuosus]MBN0043986.1 DoxX family protein [Streptomyces actuosus]
MSETTASAASASLTPAAAASVPSAGVAAPGAGGDATLTARGRRAMVALRAVQVLLALFFGLASALPKLIAHPSAVEVFDTIGWGGAGMYAIGVLELAGAVALLVPVLQSLAATALSALMVGAFAVQVTVFAGENAATPVVLIVPLLLIAWVRRRHTAELVRWVQRRS